MSHKFDPTGQTAWLFSSELLGSGKPPRTCVVWLPDEEAKTAEEAVKVFVSDNEYSTGIKKPRNVKITARKATKEEIEG